MARNVNSIARCSTYKLCHIARFADYKIGSKQRSTQGRTGQGRAGTEQGLCGRQLAGPGQFVESLAPVVSWAVGQVRVPHETGWSAMAKRRSPASRIDRPTDCLSICPSVFVCVCVCLACAQHQVRSVQAVCRCLLGLCLWCGHGAGCVAWRGTHPHRGSGRSLKPD